METGEAGLKASRYEQRSGLLITLANVTGEDVSSRVFLDLAGLSLPPESRVSVYDPLAGMEETTALQPNEALPVNVPAWMMLLVQVGGHE